MNDEATYPLRGVRVLIIEEWHVAKALTSLLTDIGMVVIGPISTIAEAERLVAEQQPELAVVGLILKGEIVDELHERGLRVIVLTGYLGSGKPLDKASAVLQKPYDAQELLATMRDVMQARASAAR
jgi:DNA-binding response OmpR family regulator